jgi:hypothetical protein
MASDGTQIDERDERRKRAFRTSPCTYWLQNKCRKGAACKFAHVDAYGQNWHEARADDAISVSSTTKQMAPWKQRRMENVVSVAESRVGLASSQPNDSSVVGNIFEWEPGPSDAQAYHWLHEERLCTTRNARIIERNAIKFKMGNGKVAWLLSIRKAGLLRWKSRAAHGNCRQL